MSEKQQRYADPNELVLVGVDIDETTHPLYDERVKIPLDPLFVNTIKLLGVLVPVLVRQEDGKLLVVDGRRRVRAAREVGGMIKVPYEIKRADDRMASAMMSVANEHRESDPPLMRARKAVRLFNQTNNYDEVGLWFKVTGATIKNWIQLIEADPKIHEAIESNKISFNAGLELSKMPSRDEQRETLAKMLDAAEKAKTQDPSKDAALNAMVESKPLVTGQQIREERETKPQPGIKRTWLKKALTTDAASGLDDDQLAVLNWIVTGQANDGDWFETFRVKASEELSNRKRKGAE